MNIYAEKELRYLIRFMDEYIEQLLYSVIEDSKEHPEFSAVAANNVIKAYIKVLSDIGMKSNYTTVKEYMIDKCLSIEEIELFEKKRESESKYYRGEQF